MLGGNVRKTMAAMARQLLLGSVRSGALVEVHLHGRRIGVGETQIAPGAVDQGNQQANHQQQHKRQPAKPASDCCLRYGFATLHHVTSERPSAGVYQTTWSGARAQGKSGSFSACTV